MLCVRGHACVIMNVGDGRVYSWGRGTLGRLGLGSEQDQLFPAQVKFGSQESVRIVGIAAGAYHSLALAGPKFFLLYIKMNLNIFYYRQI